MSAWWVACGIVLIAVVCFSGQQLAPLSFAEILGSIRGTY